MTFLKLLITAMRRIKSLAGPLRVLGVVLCASGCSALITSPSAFADTDEAAPDTVVPYVTLRDRTGSSDPDDFYGQDRSDVKSGRCLVDQIGSEFLSQAAEIAPLVVPEEILLVEAIEEAPRADLWTELRKTSKGRKPTLYVHGFFIDFEKGCRRAATLKKNADIDGAFMWFSWPSDGNILNYARDEVDMYWSVPDLADTIVEMQQEFGRERVNLIGHSLGGRGLTLALYHLSNSDVDVRVDNVILVAPDIDFEIFRKLLPRITPLANRITIYTAPSDRPLGLSQQLHGYPRLGQSGNDVSSLQGVEVIDTSELDSSSANGHLYHLYSPEVGADLNRLMTQSASAAERAGLKQLGGNLWTLKDREED